MELRLNRCFSVLGGTSKRDFTQACRGVWLCSSPYAMLACSESMCISYLCMKHRRVDLSTMHKVELGIVFC